MISSRTPEGESNHCFICRMDVVVEPSAAPGADAPCPHCGSLLWFTGPGFNAVLYKATDLSELLNRLEEWVDRVDGDKIVVDFKDVDFIGSTVLGKLISFHRKAQARGKSLRLRNLRPVLVDVFKVTKLDQLFPIDDE